MEILLGKLAKKTLQLLNKLFKEKNKMNWTYFKRIKNQADNINNF